MVLLNLDATVSPGLGDGAYLAMLKDKAAPDRQAICDAVTNVEQLAIADAEELAAEPIAV